MYNYMYKSICTCMYLYMYLYMKTNVQSGKIFTQSVLQQLLVFVSAVLLQHRARQWVGSRQPVAGPRHHRSLPRHGQGRRQRRQRRPDCNRCVPLSIVTSSTSQWVSHRLCRSCDCISQNINLHVLHVPTCTRTCTSA